MGYCGNWRPRSVLSWEGRMRRGSPRGVVSFYFRNLSWFGRSFPQGVVDNCSGGASVAHGARPKGSRPGWQEGSRPARVVPCQLKSGRGRRQTTCKPGSVRHPLRGAGAAIPLGRALLRASRDQPGRRGQSTPASTLSRHAGRPYSVLLPVGFALPPLLPGARCALAAPFHPCLRRLSLAGRPAPAVCFLWHFPWGRPRRLLAGTVLRWSPDFPPPGLPPAAAARPSGRGVMRPRRRRVNYRPRSRLIRSHAALIRATFSLARAMNSGGTPRLARLSGWFSRISWRQAARSASSAMSRGTPSTA